MKREQLDNLTEYILEFICNAGFCQSASPQPAPSKRMLELYAELTAEDDGELAVTTDARLQRLERIAQEGRQGRPL